ESQIVAFLVAVFLCFIIHVGFELMADFSVMGALEGPIKNLGIQQHYESMSRGVIDLRDVLYFLGVDVIFLLATRTVIQSRTW
ncbi:MAG: gliding motility-associated ABC transporter permease subunit GldF, partial [Flavobacteriales bacterium]